MAMRHSPDITLRIPADLRASWQSLDLSRQFLVASTLCILVAMSVLGLWLSNRVTGAVSHYSAFDAALYIEAVVGERVQGLAETRTFDPKIQRELESLVVETPLGRRIVSFKVWAKGGRVIYASNPAHVGKTYAVTQRLEEAWSGRLSYEFNDLNDHEDEHERQLSIPLLEIYAPVRQRFGGEVVAVIEFYEDATLLVAEITRAKLELWLLLAGIGALVVIALYGMARGASKIIESQKSSLKERITELSKLLSQNTELHRRLADSARRTARLNERYMKRIGSDLHDGPAQLISLALFMLDPPPPHPKPRTAPHTPCESDLNQRTREALRQALKELRQLSIGLSVPELDKYTLGETIIDAVRAHEHRIAARIRLELGNLPDCAEANELKLTTYRFLQEGLSNTRQHAQNAGVAVRVATTHDGVLFIEIADNGPGFDPNSVHNSERLGLFGMRERLESVGGSLELRSSPGCGARIIARLPFDTGVAYAQ